MTKRILALACGLALLAGTVGSEVRGNTVSATATSQTINLGAVQSITIVNSGANEIYFRLFNEAEPPATVSTTTGRYLANGATIEFGGQRLYGAISIVCDTAETATVYLYYQ